jgi:hypothetical protein
MKRGNGERLLAYVLWCMSINLYVWSFLLPWFEFTPQNTANSVVLGPRGLEARSRLEPITGEEAFYFIVERGMGGSFVVLAHPLFWIGWVLLALRRWRAATITGCLALACALNTVHLFQPREGPWFPPKIGYYLWFLSMVLLACSNLARNCLCSGDRTVSRKQLEEMAMKQQVLADQLDKLKQLADEHIDLQAANILLEMRTEGGKEPGWLELG